MKERFLKFLSVPFTRATGDLKELKELFEFAGGKLSRCESDTCISNMITAVQKYSAKNFEDKPEVNRKYILKEGNHAFAPGGPADHNNDNTSDAEIDFYLHHYPHIQQLLN